MVVGAGIGRAGIDPFRNGYPRPRGTDDWAGAVGPASAGLAVVRTAP
jgi:hypothetical protein